MEQKWFSELRVNAFQVILPVLAARIDSVLSRPGASLAGAASTALGDCLDCLYRREEFNTTGEDVSTLVMVLLRTVIQVSCSKVLGVSMWHHLISI